MNITHPYRIIPTQRTWALMVASLIFLVTQLWQPTELCAQTDPFLTHFGLNHNAINPAYSGSRKSISMLLSSRYQWAQVEGAPKTQILTLHSPLWKKNIGVGFSYMNDQVGPLKRNAVYFDYSYKMRWNRTRTLALGLKAGYDFISLDLRSLDHISATDPSLQISTKGLPKANFGFGAYFKDKDYYLGLSMPRIFGSRVEVRDAELDRVSAQQPYLYLMGGAQFKVFKWYGQYVMLLPIVQSRIVYGAPLSVDVTAHLLIKYAYWIGVTVRSDNIFGVSAQYQINSHLRLGYAYDFFLWGIQGYNQSSHEVILLVDFGRPSRVRRLIHCPRF